MDRPLQFALRELGASAQRRELTVSAEELELPEALRADGPVTVAVDLSRAQERVHLQGTARVPIQLVCVRCATEIRWELVATFELVAERPPERSQSDGEAPDGIVYYHGERLDLADEIRQMLLLEVPAHPLCGEECRGLCATCGADLNRSSCRCSAAEPSDPRWAALKSLRAKGSDRSPARDRGRRES